MSQSQCIAWQVCCGDLSHGDKCKSDSVEVDVVKQLCWAVQQLFRCSLHCIKPSVVIILRH